MKNDTKETLFVENLASFKKHAIRRRFLESISVLLLLLVAIALPISLSRIPQTGLHPNHFTHIFISLLILLIFLTRKRLSDGWISFSILFLFSVLSISGFIQYGLASAGFYFAAAAIFITSMTMGLRAGIICAVLYGLAISVIAYLWIAGFLVFPGQVDRYIVLPTVWATLGIAFLITTCILYSSAAVFYKSLSELVDTIDSQRLKIEERTAELARTNRELEEALRDIKTLSGLLPICSNCKKVRDDSGYWQQLDHYLQSHSQAKFTHSFCPDCIKKLYPGLAEKVLKKLQ